VSDPFALERFVRAQDEHGTYARALAELHAGRKQSHWMWFVFPQLTGLGASAMAQRYAIGSLQEARAYLAHPVLGGRLRESAAALDSLAGGVSAEEVLGHVDALKLRSSLTLFERADPSEQLFARLLIKFYGGVREERTEQALG
jgi:uncharacterized protein (DUF1810 family)